MIAEYFPILQPVIAIVGPTAIGKTDLSLSLAEYFNCEIVSVDSMQVYRYLDIGTAKISMSERGVVPHHLIDIVDPDEQYDANIFASDALQCIQDIQRRNKIPLLTGGTGLYLRSLIEGLFDSIGQFPNIRRNLQERLAVEGTSKLHEELHAIDRHCATRIHKNDAHRILRALEIFHGTAIPWTEHLEIQARGKEGLRFGKILQIGLTCDREKLYRRINQRTAKIIHGGLKEEVEGLFSSGYGRNLKSMQSIGYRHMAAHICDGCSIQDTEDLLARDTRHYAKRQYTWFRKMDLEWYDVSYHTPIFKRISNFLYPID